MQFASENAIHLSQRGAFRCSGLGRKEIDVNWLKISGGIGARWTNVLEYLLDLLYLQPISVWRHAVQLLVGGFPSRFGFS